MGGRVWGRAGSLALVAAIAAGCNDSTEPEVFASGTVEFEWAVQAETADTIAWAAAGSCGSRGFALGSSTCAVGSNETNFWAALGVFVNADGTYDTATIVHPAGEGSCEATFTPGTQTDCTVVFIRSRVDFPQDPVPTYVMTSGTITMTQGGDRRITGTFQGTAEDVSELGLDPIVITGGTFDVHFASAT